MDLEKQDKPLLKIDEERAKKFFEEMLAELKVNTKVENQTAEWCLRMLEMYLMQNESKTIRLSRDNGTIRIYLDNRKRDITHDGNGGCIIKYLE